MIAMNGTIFSVTLAMLLMPPMITAPTAAAIAAFVQRERVPILDGNVQRVLCRLFAVEADPRAAQTVREVVR